MMQKVTYIVMTIFILSAISTRAQYISKIWEYKPAPGQFINSAPWGCPYSANTLIGGTNGTLSLGSFGGYVVFSFENPVENDDANPYGIDFTIFGNPLTDWSEPAAVFVMKDDNGNGLPDDTWYELAGSDYFFTCSIHDYEVTYTNPNANSDIPWSDNYSNSGVITALSDIHPYYPVADSFPEINNNSYSLNGSYIVGAIDLSVPYNIRSYKRGFGYVDNNFRGVAPYTIPDNPYTEETENSGGDAFDISWAIDENGNYVDLDMIHFVKVQSAMLANAGWLGEISTEITGAVDVVPDNSITGNLDMLVLKDLPDTISYYPYYLEYFCFHSGRLDETETVTWTVSPDIARIDEQNRLTFHDEGAVQITATLDSNPEITKTVSTFLKRCCSGISSTDNNISVFPNPAQDFVTIQNAEDSDIAIFDLSGRCVINVRNYSGESIDISALKAGMFFVKVGEEIIKLVKK